MAEAERARKTEAKKPHVQEAIEKTDEIVRKNMVRIRNTKGYERKWVAEQLGVAYVTLAQWEEGRRRVGVRELAALSKIYHVDVGEFYRDEPFPVCSKCGVDILPGHKFCPECGNFVVGTYCDRCSTPIFKEHKFCPECGYILKAE